MRTRRAPWRSWLATCACLVALLGLVASTGTAIAQANEASSQASSYPEVLTLEEAASLLRVPPWDLEYLAWLGRVPARRIEAVWRFSRNALLAWLAGTDYGQAASYGAPVVPSAETQAMHEARLGESRVAPEPWQAEPLLVPTMSQIAGTGFSAAQLGTAGAADEEREPIGAAPAEKTAEEVFLREQSILLASGEVTLELGLFYSRTDDQELKTGATEITTTEDETFTSAFTTRYGLLGGNEVFASIPFRQVRSSTITSDGKSTVSRTEFGAIALGARHSVLRESLGVPEIILSVQGRIPTGDNSYAVGGGVALVKSVDPVVLFASGNYLRTFSREFDDLDLLESENRIDAALGYVFALTDTLTISTVLSAVFFSATKFEKDEIRQQEIFSLQFGLTSFVSAGLFIEPIVSFSLNRTGNSVVLGVSVPYTFRP